MIAGLLSETISIYKPSVRKGKYGPGKTVYIPHVEKTRARVTWENGALRNENNEVVYGYNLVFTMRDYHEIDGYMRIKWKDNYYRILNIIPNNQMGEIKIDAEIVNE